MVELEVIINCGECNKCGKLEPVEEDILKPYTDGGDELKEDIKSAKGVGINISEKDIIETVLIRQGVDDPGMITEIIMTGLEYYWQQQDEI